MKRKIAVVAAVIVVACVAGWLTLRGPYHKWRWAACREAAERLRSGKNTRGDEFFSLLRGRPKTYTECYEAATSHEDALIRFNYLARKEFRLRNPMTSNSAMDQFSAAATKRFPNTRAWSCVFSARGDAVAITTVTKRMQEWENFIREYDSAATPNTYRGCEWRSGSVNGRVAQSRGGRACCPQRAALADKHHEIVRNRRAGDSAPYPVRLASGYGGLLIAETN